MLTDSAREPLAQERDPDHPHPRDVAAHIPRVIAAIERVGHQVAAIHAQTGELTVWPPSRSPELFSRLPKLLLTHDLYQTRNPLHDPNLPRRARDADMAPVRHVLSFDGDAPPHSTREQVIAYRRQFLRRVATDGIRPTEVLATMGGVHVHLELSVPVEHERAGPVVRVLAKRWGGDACYAPSRLWRVPHSWAHRTPHKAKQGRPAGWIFPLTIGGPATDFARLERLAGDGSGGVDGNEREKPEMSIHSPSPPDTGDLDGEAMIPHLAQRARLAVQHPLHPHDTSRQLFGACCEMFRDDLTPEEAFAVLSSRTAQRWCKFSGEELWADICRIHAKWLREQRG